MVKLGVRVPYHEGESPASFASRLAARNLRPSVRHFCLDMGLTFQKVVDGDPDVLGRLAELGDADLEQLQRAALVRTDTRSFTLNGARLLGSLIVRNPLVVCPQCLIEDAQASKLEPAHAMFGRVSWQVRSIRTCQMHHTPLVSLNNSVERNFQHDFANQIEPFCGNLDRIGVTLPLRAPSAFEQYLAARLSDGPSASLWLDEIGFSAAAKACEMLGAIAEFGTTPNLKDLSSDQWARAGASGFDILRHGPDGLRAFLSGLQGRQNIVGSTGPQAMFGRFYQWLAFAAKDPDVTPIRDLVREHIVDTMPVGAGDMVLGRPVLQRRVHSVSTAAAEYGLHIKTLRKTLYAAGIVPSPEEPIHSAQAVFDADGAAPLLRKLVNGIPLHQLRQYLNIPRVQAKVLIDARIISPIVKAPDCDALFDKADLDAFLLQATQNAVEVSAPSSSLMTIPEASRRACCSAAKTVALLLQGQLRQVGRSTADWGYMSILVDPAEVRSKVILPPVTGIVVSTIGFDLGVKTSAVAKLLDAKFLPTHMAVNPVNRCPQRLVPVDAYLRFKSEFISLRDLARQTGIASRRLQRQLAARDISPVPEFEKLGAFLYRRDQII